MKENKNCIIRYGNKTDKESVNKIRKQVNDLHAKGRPDIFKKGFDDNIKNEINRFFDDENSDVIVATIDNVVCGFALIEYIVKGETTYNNPRKFYHIMEFGVDKHYRRIGVATNIMNFCKEESKKKSFTKLELNMWTFNESAEKFYESVGFKTYRKDMELFL